MGNGNDIYNGVNNDSSSNLAQLGRIVNSLDTIANKFEKIAAGKDSKWSGKSFDKVMSEGTSNMEKVFEKANREEGVMRMTTGQKLAQTFEKTFTAVFNYAFSQFKRGFNSIVDNYNQNFTAITSRMQKTTQEYSNMLLEHTRMIRDNSLRTQFSQIDWSNALVPVLETGIRGGLAEEMAYRNMISTRLLPMLSTNTREYTRMSKIFGERFTEGITAISTYSERFLENAEGLEENNLNDIITTTYREVMEQVRREGGTKADVTSRMQEIIGAYQTAADAYGAQTAMDMLQKYTQTLSGNAVMNGNFDEALLGVINNARSFEEFISGTENFIKRYAGSMPSGYASTAFGFSQTTIQDVLNYGAFGGGRRNTEEMLRNFDTTAETNENMYKLQKGYYKSITAQQDTFNENVMAKLGTWGAQYIPHATETISAIWNLLGQWFTIWTAKSAGNSLGGSDGLLAKLGGGAGGSVAAKSIAGIGGFVVGGALTAYHGYTAGKTTYGDTGNAGLAVGSGALSGLLTGRGFMTSDQERSNLQKALLGEHVSFDWGSAGMNALKGAGIGAGIGTAAGGWAAGSGTIIGTVIGGVGGFFSNAIQQWIENAKFNKFADAIKEVTNSITELSETANKYNTAKKQQVSFTEAYNKILKGDVKSGVQSLEEIFPEYSAKIKEITSKDDEYLGVLKQKVEYETQLQREKQAKAFSDVVGALGNAAGASEGLLSGKSEYYKQEAGKLSSEIVAAGESGRPINYDQILFQGYHDFLQKHGLSASDLMMSQYVEGLNNAGGGKLFAVDLGKGETTGYWGSKGNWRYYGDIIGLGNNVDNSGLLEEYGTSLEALKATYEELFANIPALEDAIYSDEEHTKLRSIEEVKKYYGGDTTEYKRWADGFDQLAAEMRRVKAQALSLGEGAELDWKSWAGNINALGFDKFYRAFGVEPPALRSGLYSVPYDNYLVNVHANEMILPSAASDDLRALSGATSISGVSAYLASAVASPVADDTVITQIGYIIQVQTNTLSSILESILDRVGSIHTILDGESRRRAVEPEPIPYLVQSYQGIAF